MKLLTALTLSLGLLVGTTAAFAQDAGTPAKTEKKHKKHKKETKDKKETPSQ